MLLPGLVLSFAVYLVPSAMWCQLNQRAGYVICLTLKVLCIYQKVTKILLHLIIEICLSSIAFTADFG